MDRIRMIRDDRRSAPVILGIAMVVAAAAALRIGRGVTFSGDEVVWVAATPSIDLHTVFEPHGGHLLALTRLVYWPILEIFGLGYLPFQLLALGAIFLAVGLLFVYGRRRVGDWLALAPCFVLLFYGSDFLHIFQGNGFTVLIAMALGIAALLALDRDDHRGDLLACLWLSIGVFAYSVILPFVAGILVMVLMRRDRWRRIWIPLIPAAIYVAWRIWLMASDTSSAGTGTDLANLALLPAWTFQSLSGILNSLTGLSYNFSGENMAGQVALAGPPMALVALIVFGWSVARRGLRRGLVVVVAILLALFAIQVVTSGSGGELRTPGRETRYFYPGAIAVILVAFELARGWRPGRVAVAGIMVLALAGTATNLTLMRDNAHVVRHSGEELRTYVGAAKLVSEAVGEERGARIGARISFSDNPVIALLGMTNQPYGEFGHGPEQLSAQPEDRRQIVDSVLVTLDRIGLRPADGPVSADCQRIAAGPGGTIDSTLPPGTATLFSTGGGTLNLGRFGDTPGVPVGSVVAGKWSELKLPVDSADQPWTLAFSGPDLKICVRSAEI